MTPRATIIIVSYNTRDLLRECLASLRAHAPRYPVVVADNASTDDSASMVGREFPEVTLLRNPQNIGFGAANNRALAGVKTDQRDLVGELIGLTPVLHLSVAVVTFGLIRTWGQVSRSGR